MKRFLPIFLFLIGLGVLFAAYFFVLKPGKETTLDEEEALTEVPLDRRPLATLTPSTDGHWLKLIIDKIVIDAASFDYELLYKLPDGRTQGVPGTIKLEGQKMIERDLLLGSESSGKFRYDEGVEEGTLTLRFRNEKGKLVAKFSTQFHLQSATRNLTSLDDNFSYALTKESSAFFVTMKTFGLPKDAPGELMSGPYGVFSSSQAAQPGRVEIRAAKIYRWTGARWQALEDSSSSDIGIFIALGE